MSSYRSRGFTARSCVVWSMSTIRVRFYSETILHEYHNVVYNIIFCCRFNERRLQSGQRVVVRVQERGEFGDGTLVPSRFNAKPMKQLREYEHGTPFENKYEVRLCINYLYKTTSRHRMKVEDFSNGYSPHVRVNFRKQND